MASQTRWSSTVGTRRGNRVRIYERQPGGNLYAAVWDPERKAYNQTCLDHRDHERGLRDAAELVRLRELGEDPTAGPLTLGTLASRWVPSPRATSRRILTRATAFRNPGPPALIHLNRRPDQCRKGTLRPATSGCIRTLQFWPTGRHESLGLHGARLPLARCRRRLMALRTSVGAGRLPEVRSWPVPRQRQ